MLVRCPFCRHLFLQAFQHVRFQYYICDMCYGLLIKRDFSKDPINNIQTKIDRDSVDSNSSTRNSDFEGINQLSSIHFARISLLRQSISIEAMQITDKLSIYLTGVTFKDILSSRIVEYYFYENIQITPWKLQQHSSPIEPKVKTESSTKVYHSEDIFEESDVKYMALLKPSKGQQKQTKEIKLQQEYDGQFGQVMGGKTQQSTMIKLIGEKFKCHATTLTSVIKQKRQELSEGMRSSTDTLASTFNMLKSEFKCLKSELPSLKELAIQKSLKEKYFFWRK